LPTRQPRHTGSLHGAILGVRRHMHHRRHARGRSSRLEFEDVITVDLPDDGHVDRQYLRAVFRNPHHYLPARRRRSRYLDTPLRTRGEHPIARRAKQAGLLASISALVCAVITAAVLIEHPTRSNTAQGEQERTRNNITALGAFTTAESQHPDGTNGPAARAPQATRPEETTPGSDHADHPRGSHRNHPRRESHSTATATDGTEATDEPTPAGNTGTTPSTQTTSASGATDSGAAHSHTTADSGADSRIDTVREFYSRTTSAPGQAARLLIPN